MRKPGAGISIACAALISGIACLLVPIAASADWSLAQNDPNPFCGSTRFDFDLMQTCHIQLSLWDQTNTSLVAVLLDEPNAFGPGPYSFTWDGRRPHGGPLPNGTYAYRLVADSGGTILFQAERTLQIECGYTYLVKPDGTGDFPTIQAAINAAANWLDVIALADGVYTGPGNRDITFWGKGVKIRSESGRPELCVIDCGGNATEQHRAFAFENAETRLSVLENLTITNGWADNGGAIIIADGSSPVITGCVLRNNSANPDWGSGGAIHSYGSPQILGCTIRDNVAGDRGGGVYASFSSGTLPSIEDCLILGNAGGEGGGVCCRGAARLTACIIAGNTALSRWTAGGGVSCRSMPYQQGGVYACTIYGNDAVSGGGIAFYGGAPTISRCIIASSSGGGALGWVDGGEYATPRIQFCDIWGNAGGSGDALLPGMVDVEGNFSQDPLFCGAADGNFELLSSSPCSMRNTADGTRIGAEWRVCSATAVDDAPRLSLPGPRLYPNQPNPFNPATVLVFELPESGRVSLSIYDVGGRLVRDLVDASYPAGTHRAVWNGRDAAGRAVSSGSYVARMWAGGGLQTVRMSLVR